MSTPTHPSPLAFCHPLTPFPFSHPSILRFLPVCSQQPSRSPEQAEGSAGQSSRHRPPFLSQLSGQTFYNNEYGQLSEEGLCDFFSSPSEGGSDGSTSP